MHGIDYQNIFKVPFVYEVRDLWPMTLAGLGRIYLKHTLVLGKLEDVTNTIVCSFPDTSRRSTGSVLDVDGGYWVR